MFGMNGAKFNASIMLACAGAGDKNNAKTVNANKTRFIALKTDDLNKIILSLLFYLFNYITFIAKYGILKTMNRLKKFWIVFLSFLPFSAGAASPFVVGAIAGIGVLAGFSIYRTAAPVNMADALNFFSTCWSCQMFSEIMATMSGLLPRAYSAIGSVIIPFAAGLTAVWFAWKLLSGFFNAKLEEPWSLASTFGVHVIKLAFVSALLLLPLPRLLTDVVIEPIFNVGLSINRVVAGNDDFAKCVVATAIADPVSVSSVSAQAGAFSPKLRHNLACEVANVHQLTGLGMTVGWTMLNMAFNEQYMHKIMWDVPIFPNVPIFFMGLLILVLFFFALLPVPLYFLEIFIKLSMDLIMLPFMMLSWLFKGWPIFPNGSGNIQGIINNVVKGTAGIAMVGVFVTFAVMFLNAVFGKWAGADRLQLALSQNDSTILMDGLMMRNDSIITIIMMGIFIAMFMTMIPTLVKTLFANVNIPTTFYETTKKNIKITWENLKKWYSALKK